MKSICFATNNPHKLQELQQLLKGHFQLKSLQEIGCHEELPETQETLEGNSAQKAKHVWKHYQIGCFADDTGLEVYALNNEPGVHSAHYAGSQRNSTDNINLLLKNMEGVEDRASRFRTIITLILEGKEHQFEGIVEGYILSELRGTDGFGYDPIFVPKGYEKTFAEMSMDEKNILSHRGKAVRKLVDFLQGV